jgi:hypothetical protein
LPNVVVQVYQNGLLKGGCVSDYDGNFIIRPLEIGSYDVTVIYWGYDTLIVNNVRVTKEDSTLIKLEYQMLPNSTMKSIIVGYVKPYYAEPTKKRRRK